MCVCVCILFIFFSIKVYHRMLNIVPCAIPNRTLFAGTYSYSYPFPQLLQLLVITIFFKFGSFLFGYFFWKLYKIVWLIEFTGDSKHSSFFPWDIAWRWGQQLWKVKFLAILLLPWWLRGRGSPGEGNGVSLQCPCLGNPVDRGAWWATVPGVTTSLTQLSK